MRIEWRDLPLASRRAAAAGGIALIVCAIGGAFDPPAFFAAWLVNWLFLLGIALAAMMDVMIHELTGGKWGTVLRPPLEGAMTTLPSIALLAVPLAFGVHDLFPWARQEVVADSELLQAKQWFLNAPGFLVRNAVWLVVWSAFALVLRSQLERQAPGNREPARRLSVAGLLVYLFTITVAAYDWVASLVPDWSSTAIGIRLGVSQFIAAFAFAVPFCLFVRSAQLDAPKPTVRDLQDFGNLLITFALMWAYIAFTQYLIVWAEDLPHETSWYAPRVETSWRWLAIAVAALVFALPVVAMLFRPIKRNAKALGLVCLLVLVGAWLDALWLVAPSLRHGGFSVHWLDIAALVAEGGLWLALMIAIDARALPIVGRRRVKGAPAHG